MEEFNFNFKRSNVIKAMFGHNTYERESGDEMGIYIYAFFCFFSWVTLMFFQDDTLSYLINFYINFDMVCIVFLVLYFWRNKTKSISIPAFITFMKIVLFCSVFMLILYGFGEFLYLIIGRIHPGNLTYPIFEYTRLIPIEEMVFRGLGIELFLILEERETRSSLNVPPEKKRPIAVRKLFKARQWFPDENVTVGQLLKQNKYFLLGAIANSVIFGLLHFQAYPDQVSPLIYLILMGLMASWLRFKYGLIASMSLHLVNNIAAQAMALLFILG